MNKAQSPLYCTARGEALLPHKHTPRASFAVIYATQRTLFCVPSSVGDHKNGLNLANRNLSLSLAAC